MATHPHDVVFTDPTPTVLSASGSHLFAIPCRAGLDAHLVIQPEPRGMGDSVLRFNSHGRKRRQPYSSGLGDLAGLQLTVSVVTSHINRGNDFPLLYLWIKHTHWLNVTTR